MKTERSNEDLRLEAPLLEALRGQPDPFIVEPGFFEHFPHQVQAMATARKASAFPVWLKRVAIALPVAGLVLFAVHAVQPKIDAQPVAISVDNGMIDELAGQMDTDEILAEAGNEGLQNLGEVTVQLSPEEALAYIDQNQIDLNDYLY